jgi:hypothetical protein
MIDKVLYCCVNWLAVSGNYDPLQSKFTVQSWDKYLVWLKSKVMVDFAPSMV